MTTSNDFTYAELASDLNLWQEYIDVNGVMDAETFESTPLQEKVGMIITAFGPEEEK